MQYRAKSGFKHADLEETVGVLLVNLGTPEAPTTSAVRRYLAEFLADPRVIELPRWLWWPILHGVILRIRPSRSAKAYQKVWTDDGSPLLVHSEQQSEALARRLETQFGSHVRVKLAMRYGNPAIADVLREFQDEGLRRLLVLPLYPQYSAATTASIFDAVCAELAQWRWLPEMRFITEYHDRPSYIEALANSIRERWQEEGQADKLLFSFHGLPRRYLHAGDPYHCQCHKTARLVSEQLQLTPEQWQVSFQSRVGREEWLRPYTDEILQQWGKENLASVQVVCPGFAADCLETLEEMDMQNRDFFQQAGGGRFTYIPALNSRADHIDALTELTFEHLGSWPANATANDATTAGAAERASASPSNH